MAMDKSKATISINPAFLPFLIEEKGNSIEEVVNVSLAIYLFTARKVTLAHAAELSSKSLPDFIQILIDHHINWAEYTEEDKKQDDETIDYILKNVEKNDKSYK